MMRLPPFSYRAPRTVTEAARIAAGEGAGAQFVAGGTDLFPNMKRRQQTPAVVVGLRGVHDLATVRGDPATGLVLGACVTLTDVCEDERVRSYYPGLARAVRSISTPLLRNAGTLGGNLCLDTRCNYYDQSFEWRKAISFCMKKEGDTCWVAPGSPRCWAVASSDAAPLLIALGASVTLLSAAGGAISSRAVPVEGLYRDDGIRYLAKDPHELLTEVRLPAADSGRATYWKLRRRGAFDFPVLGVAGWVAIEGDRVRQARIVYTGVGSCPKRGSEGEAFLAGKRLDRETIREAARLASGAARALDNTDFAMGWRKRMSQTYTERMLLDLAGLPWEGHPAGRAPLGAGFYAASG